MRDSFFNWKYVSVSALLVLAGCDGKVDIPLNYVGTYQGPEGRQIELAQDGVRISGFAAIGAEDQWIKQSMVGYDQILNGIWGQRSAVYVLPAEDQERPTAPAPFGFIWPENSQQCQFASEIPSSKTVMNLFVITGFDLNAHHDVGDYDSVDSISGSGAVVAFSIDLGKSNPITELETFARKAKISARTWYHLGKYDPCPSDVDWELDEGPAQKSITFRKLL